MFFVILSHLVLDFLNYLAFVLFKKKLRKLGLVGETKSVENQIGFFWPDNRYYSLEYTLEEFLILVLVQVQFLVFEM